MSHILLLEENLNITYENLVLNSSNEICKYKFQNLQYERHFEFKLKYLFKYFFLCQGQGRLDEFNRRTEQKTMAMKEMYSKLAEYLQVSLYPIPDFYEGH